MELEEAKDLLTTCTRSELRDHAFGDTEVVWVKDDVQIADGYFSSTWTYVSFSSKDGSTIGLFKDDQARQLRSLGTVGHVERNDETGPDKFVEGKVMPRLTKESVFREITRKLGDTDG